MRVAICPGSFDPITLGHLDIITRSAKLFDRVIVLVMTNYNKKDAYSFTPEERMQMIRRCITDLDNVTVDTYDGLLADYARQQGAVAIVKGLRAVSDFEYEFQQALINKELNSEVDTVFVTTRSENMFLSSSVVKHICSLGADISSFVPPEVCEEITQRIKRGV